MINEVEGISWHPFEGALLVNFALFQLALRLGRVGRLWDCCLFTRARKGYAKAPRSMDVIVTLCRQLIPIIIPRSSHYFILGYVQSTAIVLKQWAYNYPNHQNLVDKTHHRKFALHIGYISRLSQKANHAKITQYPTVLSSCKLDNMVRSLLNCVRSMRVRDGL